MWPSDEHGKGSEMHGHGGSAQGRGVMFRVETELRLVGASLKQRDTEACAHGACSLSMSIAVTCWAAVARVSEPAQRSHRGDRLGKLSDCRTMAQPCAAQAEACPWSDVVGLARWDLPAAMQTGGRTCNLVGGHRRRYSARGWRVIVKLRSRAGLVCFGAEKASRSYSLVYWTSEGWDLQHPKLPVELCRAGRDTARCAARHQENNENMGAGRVMEWYITSQVAIM